MCRGIGASEQLEVLVQRSEWRADVESALSGLPVRLHDVAFGDIGMRDSAPVFLERGSDGARRAASFRWTGWGGKYDYPGDAEVARAVAARADVDLYESPLGMEGGGLEHDGEGTLITTRECALSPARNPGLSEDAVQRELSRAVGARCVLWIDRGLHNDHTDGHVDNVARFVAPGRVLCARPSGNDDPNRQVLLDIAASLESSRDAQGRKLEVVTIPSPGRVESRSGELLPASHVNFYIANGAVVVPVYGGAEEDRALRELGELFPGREVWPVPAQVFLEEGGAVHCITQQEPAE